MFLASISAAGMPQLLQECRSSYNCQSMGVFPRDIRISLVFEKWRHPKNPREAESGDGCGAVRI